jgi:pilus assembly protein CpaE
MAKTPEVLIITTDPMIADLATSLRGASLEAESVGSYSDARRVAERTPDFVAVIDGDLPPELYAQVDKLIHGARPAPSLVLVAPGSYHQLAASPDRPSLDEYVAKPVRPEELVLRVKAMMLRAGYDIPDAGAAWGRDGRMEPEGIHHGAAIAVFAAKGGVGKTTVDVNLAVGLSQLFHEKVLLVDTDLWFGDAGVLLNVYSSKSLFDVASGGEIDLHRLQGAVVTHESGVSILLRPPNVSMAEKVDASALSKAISEYKALFDYVIVDTHPSFDELNLQVLDVVDRILVVCTPEISTTHNTSRFLEVAQVLDYAHKLTLVLNRSNSGVRIDAMESTLGLPISATIVSAGRAVVDAANQGMAMFTKDPQMQEQVTRDLGHLVELVAGRVTPGTKPEAKKVEGRRFFPLRGGAR